MAKKIDLTAVVLTKNSQATIRKCLDSVSFCRQIIVIDDGSTDNTLKIVKDYYLRIYRRELDFFSNQRDFGMEKARTDWVLFVDSDEVVSKKLSQSIRIAISRPTKNGAYYIKRRDFWWGRELKYGEVSKIRKKGIIRLVKKNSGHWSGEVHEVFKTKFSIGKLVGFLNHYPHQNLAAFIHQVNFYSTLRAQELKKAGKKTNILAIISFPFFKFIYTYFLKLGFLDGVAGFVYSFMMSFHSFLVRAKLYQYTRLDEKENNSL